MDVQHPCCQARSKHPVTGVEWWYCSLPPGHEGPHEAYDLNVIRPTRFIERWSD